MITLLIVGPAVEVMLGKSRFLALYLLAGLGGNVLSYLIAPATGSAPARRAPSSGSWAPTWCWPASSTNPWARWSP